MSHDLCLYSHFEEFPLVGNPEADAPGLGRATVFSGNADRVVAWYELYCRGLGWDEATWAVHLNNYDCLPPPAWADPDPVTRHIAMINAFLALAPGAKFGAS